MAYRLLLSSSQGRAKKCDPWDTDVHVAGIAADGVDVLFLAGTTGACGMERTRGASLSLYECLAVVAALGLQLASLLALLGQFTAH